MERRNFIETLAALAAAVVAFPRDLLAERPAAPEAEIEDLDDPGVSYHVDPHLKAASDDNDGLSWPTALRTMPEAVDRASFGNRDRIYVRAAR